jgi:hypothetical protein
MTPFSVASWMTTGVCFGFGSLVRTNAPPRDTSTVVETRWTLDPKRRQSALSADGSRGLRDRRENEQARRTRPRIDMP